MYNIFYEDGGGGVNEADAYRKGCTLRRLYFDKSRNRSKSGEMES